MFRGGTCVEYDKSAHQVLALSLALVALLVLLAAAGAKGGGDLTLTATRPGADDYAPTFTGNGLLGVRVPPAGQGYASGTVPAQSELAGFYAQRRATSNKRINTPTWVDPDLRRRRQGVRPERVGDDGMAADA